MVVTLRMDPESFDRLNRERREHFPPERNVVPAHISLFHNLPDSLMNNVAAPLTAPWQRQPSMSMQVTGLRSLGGGVAYVLEAPALLRLRADLALAFGPFLTPQDRQAFRPHITIQNKVASEEADRLLRDMRAEFVPFTILGVGVDLWHYRNGPWEWIQTCAFQRPSS